MELDVPIVRRSRPHGVEVHHRAFGRGKVVDTLLVIVDFRSARARRPPGEGISGPREGIRAEILRSRILERLIGHRAAAAVRVETHGVVVAHTAYSVTTAPCVEARFFTEALPPYVVSAPALVAQPSKVYPVRENANVRRFCATSYVNV